MKTPYDAALRIRQGVIDDMRVSITVEVNRASVIDDRRDAIDTVVRSEVELARSDFAFPAHAFVARMRAERETLSRERAASETRLTALRAQALEAYGSLSAIGAAADRHRAETLRIAAIVEQSQVDDFSAAGFTRQLYALRRARKAHGA